MILEEARKRHDLEPRTGTRLQAGFALPAIRAQVYQTWAWWALMSGHVSPPRKHALTCIRRAPLSLSTWRLVYCALRGH